MAVHGYTKNYKLIKPQFDTDTWHDYEYDNLDTIDAVLSAIFASGDWKGFWKTNTHYSVGGVVIDQATDTMYKIMVEHTSSAATFSEEQAAHPDYYELWSPNNLAESWAIKTDDKVSNTDYSAKAYAISSGLIDDGSAKEWAVGSGAIGNTGEYSAKKYATDAHNDYISMTTNPNVAAVASNINNVNAVGQSISNVNTVATNISDVNTAATNIAAIKDAPNQAANAAQSATNAASSATASAGSATASATSANNSHIWAEGTDAQVQALGGIHSSKGWAEQSTNANIALTNSPYTTNRILEIPQDIKLELNNGTLTLKAGSKVYVPNGFEADGTTPKFDVVTIESDRTLTRTINGTYFVTANMVGGTNITNVSSSSSGTNPTPQSYSLQYNTTNNEIKRYTDSTSSYTKDSFPVAVVTVSNSAISSIDQVFNGFGYIGSTVFALPGVKVQTPNGRNKDGTYKTVIRTVDSVKPIPAGDWGTRNLNIQFSGSLDFLLFDVEPVERFTYNKKFSSDTTTYSYDENTGIWWYSSDQSSWITFPGNLVGSCRVESGKITSFEPYTVDSVVNSNASNFSQAGRSYLSGLGMPSSRYIDLTLGASGSSYTAPANGYFSVAGAFDTTPSQTNVVYLMMSCGGLQSRSTVTVSVSAGVSIPAKKGQSMYLEYRNFKLTGYSYAYFRFVYAEGEN